MAVVHRDAAPLLPVREFELGKLGEAETRAGTGFTSLNSHLSQLAPSVLAAMRSGVTQTLGAAAWDHWIAALLATPTFAVFSLIGAVCAYAARKRHKIRVFIN